ncbi:ubiquitin carboxyl-terminal hydrolase Usp2 isoform X6 [Lucilia cuprina]|uniref:ubiquitin carboxyl-terminal hydrolase Usp2 isoform X6 n=1 Tax=Lucilia cuprina TaxID=7375 RepID=UPI001F062C8E|nr:ubiquitin carboxyl-terminal hydrolase Usp2 isoform X6 [Lucilia cuprina]
MIDVKKTRNNFQKLPSLKQRCDPVVKPQTAVRNTKQTATTLKNNIKNPANDSATKTNSTKATNVTSKTNGSAKNSNPVREANQHFFLVQEFKDQNFLKAECELAHAQVYKPSLTENKTLNKNFLPAVVDNSRSINSFINKFSTTNNNLVRNSATLRSVLPPASPTSSRYYDRDSSRSALLTSSTSSHNSTDDNKKSTASEEETEGLCGLRNIGNTCFMNSIIQCLSHTNELTKFLRNYNATKSPTSKDQQILYEFSKLIKEMWTNNVNSVTPMELKRSFSAKHRMYSDYNQQDAQEFLRFFLDSLHGALNSGTKGEHLKIDDNLSDNKKAELTWEWYGRHENSLIRDLFVGQLKSTLRCTTCGNTSVTFDPFWDLSVPLPSSSRCKLDACLDLFIREEVLDGDEMPTCSKCQTRRKCTKSFTIQRFPKYLVIHLKRFSETRWSKLSNIVEFPTGERELNMGPYGANANSNQYYSLYAISNHMGSTAGGHYVAICKHPVSKKWHEFNDNLVSDSLSEHHLVSSSAYILFYERA